MKDQTYSTKDKIIQIITEEQEEPHAHKPFMTKVPVKATPIGYEFHQIDIPEFDSQKALRPCHQKKIKWGNLQVESSVPVFLSSKTKEEEVFKYLNFIQNYLQQKAPDYFHQSNIHFIMGIHHMRKNSQASCRCFYTHRYSEGSHFSFYLLFFIYLASRERTRSMALRLLHDSSYNYTKAKFYILFPYYRTYNTYKRHQPLILSDEQMEHKINAHIESLKSSKQNDLMKWVKTIQNQMQSRIHISRINNYIEAARQNKFQIPDSIKDIIQRSVKIGKEIKKNILNSKNTIQKLQTIKLQLLDNKIVTNEMIHFEEAVLRAEEWIKKQNKFQEEYFYCIDTQSGDTEFTLKEKDFFREFGKIQYRTVQSLVNQYNSLPLHYPAFNKTTSILYDETNKLIAKLPSLSKAAKTRKSEQGNGVVKIPRKLITEILTQINQIPVEHEDFISFEYSITDGLQQLEKISMLLEDTKFEKNLKNLNQYQKLLGDIPIQNDVQKKLNERIEYYELIDRIKKDISNPSKYDSLKDQIIKLKEKGYQTVEHAKLQSRVMTCMGWHDSQQLIREQKKIPSRTYLILNQKTIKSKMIKFQIFQAQLFSARNELNIPDDILKQSEQRLEVVNQLRDKILEILQNEDPNLVDFITIFKATYDNGISFLQFQELYQKLTTILIIIAKIHFLLNTEQTNTKPLDFYFTNNEAERIIEYVCEKRHEIKDLRTKETGDEIIAAVNNMNFPKNINEWKHFQQFMRKAQEWSDRAMKIIDDFKHNNNMYNTRQGIEESRHCLHSKLIEEELNKIQIALKWRQKISRKMADQNITCFDQDDDQFMEKLQKDLQAEQHNFFSQDQMMFRALQYMHQHSTTINKLLYKISNYPVQKLIILKLSQMNKFVKEIDRQVEKYQIKDRVIDELKEQLQIELIMNEDWKERYLAIKRFQKKKIGQNSRESNHKRKDDDDLPDVDISFDLMKDEKEEQNHEFYSGAYIPKAMMVSYSPSLLVRPKEIAQNHKRKYVIKNGEFCLYYRMLLMLFEFYNACLMKFAVEEFIKLKNALTDIYRLIEKYYGVYEKSDPTDGDFQYLESEACKIPIFFNESYLVTNKYAQIQSWKAMAEHVLRSVPVINMELKARKIEELKQMLEKQKHQDILNQSKLTEEQINQNTSKRRRKPNQLYQNDEITLFRDDILISKTKKRKTSKFHQSHQSLPMVEDYRSGKKVKQQKQKLRDDKQSIERIDELLKGNLQLMIDDPKQYCICRNGVPNENTLMVCCEECNQWFHIQCVGIKKHQAKNDDNYHCVACKSLSDQYEPNFGYFWDHHQKITEYALIDIYKQGKSLQITIPQLTKITLVYNAMIKWKQDTDNLLRKLVEENPTNFEPYEDQIYPLYLQSLWLPTIHYEHLYLKALMKRIKREMQP